MAKAHFLKMQAAGNDFILIDESRSMVVPDSERKEFIVRMCERHFGVGSDGMIFVRPSGKSDVRFMFYNPDGSEAEMCGNGLRCFVKYVYERGIARKSRIRIETRAGELEAEPILKGSVVKEVRLDMGRPSLRRRDIPAAGSPDEAFVDQSVQVNGSTHRITAVGMGNPHAVIFVDDVGKTDVLNEGRRVREHTSLFPNGVNVHFVQKMGEDEFSVRTYERGVEEETLACGTGICASAVAVYLRGMSDGREPILFHARGGDLRVELVLEGEDVKKIFLTGPVEEVFSGEMR
jgi:diaminopimelate epimerase